jgi:hypothetical protein
MPDNKAIRKTVQQGKKITGRGENVSYSGKDRPYPP